MPRIIIAIDGSKGALRAVDYAALHYSGFPEVAITLFHVMEGIPPALWDDGHILNEEEKASREELIAEWAKTRQGHLEALFKPAFESLCRKGIGPDQIETKSLSESVTNVAECIAAEARSGNYQTLILGRSGLSHPTEAVLGGVVSQVVHRGAGRAICIVE